MNRKISVIAELKARREALGWSIDQVATRCGVDRKLLADAESGGASPRLDATERWAAALGLRLAALAGEGEGATPLQVDWSRRRITVDGAPVQLTVKEWTVLECLARTPGEIVTHQDLFRHVYGDDRLYRAGSTAIRVLINKLRRLLPIRIDPRWGKGYVISGIEPPTMSSATQPDPASTHKPVRGAREEQGFAAKTHARRPPAPVGLGQLKIDTAALRLELSSTPLSRRRTEELGIIEQFLSNRGAIICPNQDSIQKSPLPTLIWDKTKRKWVRPGG